jgi:hypothetical protein
MLSQPMALSTEIKAELWEYLAWYAEENGGAVPTHLVVSIALPHSFPNKGKVKRYLDAMIDDGTIVRVGSAHRGAILKGSEHWAPEVNPYEKILQAERKVLE